MLSHNIDMQYCSYLTWLACNSFPSDCCCFNCSTCLSFYSRKKSKVQFTLQYPLQERYQSVITFLKFFSFLSFSVTDPAAVGVSLLAPLLSLLVATMQAATSKASLCSWFLWGPSPLADGYISMHTFLSMHILSILRFITLVHHDWVVLYFIHLIFRFLLVFSFSLVLLSWFGELFSGLVSCWANTLRGLFVMLGKKVYCNVFREIFRGLGVNHMKVWFLCIKS